MPRRNVRLICSALLVATALLAAGSTAFAQASAYDRQCIQEINNSTRKVLLAENKAIQACVRSLVKGTLAPPIAPCVAATGSPKTQKAIVKANADAQKRCPSGPPSFGPASRNAHPLLAVDTGIGGLKDLFGSSVETALLTDAAGAKCQANVMKAVHRCDDMRQKELLKCKKTGLKSGAIVDASSLQNECLGTGAEQPDPKSRIAISCESQVQAQINASCVAAGVSLAQAFPACGQASSNGLTECLDGRSRCRVCALTNAVDGTAKDCDVFDDGNDANQSCDEPTTCGDLFVDGKENCEDGNAAAGDGCSSSCRIETGWSCSGHPSVCHEICNDGLVVGHEACDDGNGANGDGCSATCGVETGYSCSGSPSNCRPICGDGLITGTEQCDDGNANPHDGCGSTCAIEGGFSCQGQPSTCTRFSVTITSPAQGAFTTASSVNITGTVNNLSPALAGLTINGAPVTVAPNGTFSTSMPLSAAAIFNPIEATLVDVVHGGVAHARHVVIAGASVADGAFSPQSIGLRLNDTGLDKIEPLVAALAGEGFNLATLVPVGTVLINNECFVNVITCLGRATVRVANPPPSASGIELAIDSQTNFVAGDVTVRNIRIDLQIDGSGVVPSCGLRLTANAAFFFGDYALSPDAINPSNIDVNQVGPLDIAFSGFNRTFTSGLCNAPIIGDIIQALLPDIEQLALNAMRNFLNDPDGAGPQDGPIADAIEEALAGISIAGPIGESLGVVLESPLFAVNEDPAGITLGSNSRVYLANPPAPGQCVPPPGAPNLTRSLAFTNDTFPTFGATVSGVPYDAAISISAEGFNQLLKAQIECGLLITSITELDIGFGPLPLTSDLLALLLPEFAIFQPGTPLRINIRPTIAPVVTGAAGPNGELTELRVANVLAEVVIDDGSNEVVLSAAFDTSLGMNLVFQPGALAISLTPPDQNAILIAIVDNPLGVAEEALETTILPPLIGSLLPDLSSALSSFPLPTFFELELNGVTVRRDGMFLTLYANLVPAP